MLGPQISLPKLFSFSILNSQSFFSSVLTTFVKIPNFLLLCTSCASLGKTNLQFTIFMSKTGVI
jgi:hypothetical protein